MRKSLEYLGMFYDNKEPWTENEWYTNISFYLNLIKIIHYTSDIDPDFAPSYFYIDYEKYFS